MPLHPEAERLQAQHEQERVERRHRGSDVSQQLHASPGEVGVLAEVLPETEVVICRRRLGQHREVPVGVVEPPRLDDDATDRHAVPSDELGRRVCDDVGSVVHGPTQIRRREGVVDNQREPAVMGDARDGLDVEDVGSRVADRLPVQQLRAVGDRLLDEVDVGEIDKRDIDSHPSQRHIELGVGAPVERLRRDDLVALPAERKDGDELGRLTGRGGERSDATLERRHSFLECSRGGVADPGVDVPVRLEGEQIGGVLCVVEHERGRCVDRLGARPGLGVWALPGVDRSGVEAVFVIAHASTTVPVSSAFSPAVHSSFVTVSPVWIAPASTTRAFTPRRRSAFPSGELTQRSASAP